MVGREEGNASNVLQTSQMVFDLFASLIKLSSFSSVRPLEACCGHYITETVPSLQRPS
jgi:hypothetical protein